MKTQTLNFFVLAIVMVASQPAFSRSLCFNAGTVYKRSYGGLGGCYKWVCPQQRSWSHRMTNRWEEPVKVEMKFCEQGIRSYRAEAVPTEAQESAAAFAPEAETAQ